MKSFDICLYGHLSFDNIYESFYEYYSIGCIANVWRHLKIINPDLRIKIVPTEIGESLIIVDKHNSLRASTSVLSMRTKEPIIYESPISHVMYINELMNSGFINKLNGFVAADVCNGKPLNINDGCLKNINLLFIADEDVKFDINLLRKNIKGSIIVHSPRGSTLYTKRCIQHFTAELVDNINVLGAGDKFAAHVLLELIANGYDIPNSIDTAHKNLTLFFKNEKI